MDRVPRHEQPDDIKPKKQALIAKNKHELLMHQQQLRRTLTAPPLSSLRHLPQPQQRVSVAEVKLAAVVAELNVRARLANMPAVVQERAFRCARALIDAQGDKKLTPTQIAMHLKKQFDSLYGLAWHCIVGKSFGSFVTHSSGGFVYFSIGKLSFLLFKTEVRPVTKTNPLLKMK